MSKVYPFFISDNGIVDKAVDATSLREPLTLEPIIAWLAYNAIPSSKKSKLTSYELKHKVETALGKYISNGAMIQACIDAGYEIARIDGGPNAYIYADFIDSNPIKRICKDHSLTYAQLSEQIGYGEEAISKAARTGEVSKPMAKALDLFTENMALKEETKTLDDLKNIFERVISRK